MSTQNDQSPSPKLSWSALFHTGSVVSLSVSLWRARSKILPEDLGIEDTADVRAALSLGCHRLAPAAAFEDILATAREAQKIVDQLSVNFGLIKGARFIPEKNIAPLLVELRRLQNQFYAQARELSDNHEPMKAGMFPIIYEALKSAAKTPEAAETAYTRLQAEYPSAGEVLSKFHMGWSIYAIKSPKSAEAGRFAEQETAEVKSIIGDMVKQLRDETSETLKTVIALATKGGKLNKRTIEAAQATVERIASLNILGDQVLTDQLAAMRKALALVDRSEVDQGFVSGLTQIQTTLETSIDQAVAAAERSLTGVGQRAIELEEEDESHAELVTSGPAPGTAGPLTNGHITDAFEGL